MNILLQSRPKNKRFSLEFLPVLAYDEAKYKLSGPVRKLG